MELKKRNNREEERNRNEENIYNYVCDFISKYDKQPTYKEIAKKLTLNIKTVMKHMQTLTNNKTLPKRVLRFSMHFDGVTRAVVEKAQKGDIAACRLYYSLVWNFNEKNNSTDTTQIAERPIINITTTNMDNDHNK
jgi:radical SAM superfamily enzyme with C-terminal helix-hairpin-helix motif